MNCLTISLNYAEILHNLTVYDINKNKRHFLVLNLTKQKIFKSSCTHLHYIIQERIQRRGRIVLVAVWRPKWLILLTFTGRRFLPYVTDDTGRPRPTLFLSIVQWVFTLLIPLPTMRVTHDPIPSKEVLPWISFCRWYRSPTVQTSSHFQVL